jgi:hypothetical protein
MAIAAVSRRAASFRLPHPDSSRSGSVPGPVSKSLNTPMNEALLPDIAALITGEYRKLLSVL